VATHRDLLHERRVAELLRPHVVRVRDRQAAERAADEVDVLALHVAHDQDLGLGLRHARARAGRIR
jgi:hypothetical protein